MPPLGSAPGGWAHARTTRAQAQQAGCQTAGYSRCSCCGQVQGMTGTQCNIGMLCASQGFGSGGGGGGGAGRARPRGSPRACCDSCPAAPLMAASVLQLPCPCDHALAATQCAVASDMRALVSARGFRLLRLLPCRATQPAVSDFHRAQEALEAVKQASAAQMEAATSSKASVEGGCCMGVDLASGPSSPPPPWLTACVVQKSPMAPCARL
jgi:hypothetical protein